MTFQWQEAREILARTPGVLHQFLSGTSEGWLSARERPDSWSPAEVLGHLIHGEKQDWVVRAQIILEHGPVRPFTPFDRFAHLEWCGDRSVQELLDEFGNLRAQNIKTVDAIDPGGELLGRSGTHPTLGRVTLGQLLATWVVHDLNHLNQISRALAARYRESVGPWNKRDFLRILHAG